MDNVHQSNQPVCYLASPYSHANPEIRQARYRTVCKVAGKLMKDGMIVFCPIAHSHPISEFTGNAVDHNFWLSQDLPLLSKCDHLLVVKMPGWQDSRGVKAEIEFAEEMNIPITYLDHEEGIF